MPSSQKRPARQRPSAGNASGATPCDREFAALGHAYRASGVRNARRVLTERVHPPDGWAIAVWFFQPSPRLHGARPLDFLNTNFPEVLQAARTHRLSAAG